LGEQSKRDAFIREVYQPFYQDVYQFCLYFTNHEEEAKDLTQETFIKALKSIDKFQGRSSTKTWIISIARNTTIDHHRKKKFQRLLPHKWAKEQITSTSTDYEVENQGDWEVLQKSLMKLKSDYRQVVILRALKDFSVKETAEILGWSESKVRVSYHRALKEMRKTVGLDSEGVVIYEEAE